MCPIIPNVNPVVAVPLTTSSCSDVKCMNGKNDSFAGICWLNQTQSKTATDDATSTGQITKLDEVDRLNELVQIKIKKFMEESTKTGIPLPVEVQTVVSGNLTVYQKRYTFLPMFFFSFSCLLLSTCVSDRPMTILVAALFSYIYYDFLSGILHIVLDNPENLKLPILKEPCLEFLWHHHIPTDIASKPFLQVCGDLNLTIILLNFAYLSPILGIGFRTPMALCLIAWKVIFAYFGQLCHCMSHMPPHNRPEWVLFLQRNHLMISPKEHMIHHSNYNDNFCIGSGVCNPLISTMKSYSSNQWLWLGIFAVCFFSDIPVANYLFCHYAGFE